MAAAATPHFHNTRGIERIEIGAKEFKCIGAKPPYDHPHIFLDMGGETEIVCSYCSTHYAYNPALAHSAANPADCAYDTDDEA